MRLAATLVVVALLVSAQTAVSAEYVASAGVWSIDEIRFFDSDVSAAVGEVSVLLEQRHWDISLGWAGSVDKYRVGDWQYISAQRVMRFQEIIRVPIFAGVGLIARSDGDRIDEFLPSVVSFSISAGLDIGHFRVQFRHASNAGLKSPNRGANWLLVGWIF